MSDSVANRHAVPQSRKRRAFVPLTNPPRGQRARNSWNTPSADEYAQFRPLLFRALALLSRQGYRADADVGIEIVHDFFIEAWPGLRERYDSKKGAFSTYVFAAFVRFARPKIVSMQKHDARLLHVDAAALDRFAAPLGDNLRVIEQQQIRRAFRELSTEDQTLLMAWVEHGSSERRLARARDTSRHRLRNDLVAALARLAVRMRERVGASDGDWRVAKALWSEDRSVADTAAALDMTAAQVRLARQRVFEMFIASIRTDGRRSAEEDNHVR
jgi:hypothetical protein